MNRNTIQQISLSRTHDLIQWGTAPSRITRAESNHFSNVELAHTLHLLQQQIEVEIDSGRPVWTPTKPAPPKPTFKTVSLEQARNPYLCHLEFIDITLTQQQELCFNILTGSGIRRRAFLKTYAQLTELVEMLRQKQLVILFTDKHQNVWNFQKYRPQDLHKLPVQKHTTRDLELTFSGDSTTANFHNWGTEKATRAPILNLAQRTIPEYYRFLRRHLGYLNVVMTGEQIIDINGIPQPQIPKIPPTHSPQLDQICYIQDHIASITINQRSSQVKLLHSGKNYLLPASLEEKLLKRLFQAMQKGEPLGMYLSRREPASYVELLD